jgi:hypothetical protein
METAIYLNVSYYLNTDARDGREDFIALLQWNSLNVTDNV